MHVTHDEQHHFCLVTTSDTLKEKKKNHVTLILAGEKVLTGSHQTDHRCRGGEKREKG